MQSKMFLPAGTSVMASPLKIDPRAAAQMLQDLKPGFVPAPGRFQTMAEDLIAVGERVRDMNPIQLALPDTVSGKAPALAATPDIMYESAPGYEPARAMAPTVAIPPDMALPEVNLPEYSAAPPAVEDVRADLTPVEVLQGVPDELRDAPEVPVSTLGQFPVATPVSTPLQTFEPVTPEEMAAVAAFAEDEDGFNVAEPVLGTKPAPRAVRRTSLHSIARKPAELRAYHPTWRERATSFLMGPGKPSPEEHKFAAGLMGTHDRPGIADLVPIASQLLAMQEAYRDGEAQDFAMAVLPGARLAKPAVKGAKKVSNGLAEVVTAPAVQTGKRPLFDYSRLSEVPDVPQFDLKRYDPPRGVPERTKAIASPDNMVRVRDVVKRGQALGGEGWYNTEPLRQAFIEELGEEKGAPAFARFIDYVAATSPRSKVDDNLRNASYYYTLDRQGQAFPKITRQDGSDRLEVPPPFPYRHRFKVQHARNAHKVRRAGGWDPFVLENPKPVSFAQNLKGNQRPVTSDVHNARILGMKNAQGREVHAPAKNEYAFVERLQQGEASKLGLTPAQYQSSAWIGGAEETGQRSGIDPFLRLFERRLTTTSKRLGIPKREVLRRMIRGELPLYGVAGILGLGALTKNDASHPGSH